jgi:hypothetical protein
MLPIEGLLVYIRVPIKVSRLEIIKFGGLNGPLQPQNSLEKVGGEACRVYSLLLCASQGCQLSQHELEELNAHM